MLNMFHTPKRQTNIWTRNGKYIEIFICELPNTNKTLTKAENRKYIVMCTTSKTIIHALIHIILRF